MEQNGPEMTQIYENHRKLTQFQPRLSQTELGGAFGVKKGKIGKIQETGGGVWGENGDFGANRSIRVHSRPRGSSPSPPRCYPRGFGAKFADFGVKFADFGAKFADFGTHRGRNGAGATGSERGGNGIEATPTGSER